MKVEEMNLKFDSKGLIPAIITDNETGKVLMLAYMNSESIEKSLETGKTCFWSRSRKELWLKGETSGNYQNIVSMRTDCDRDTLLISVNKEGPACHTGAESCFFNKIIEKNLADSFVDTNSEENPVDESAADSKYSFEELYKLLLGRKQKMPEGSYTTYLFEKGLDKILKKIGEESTEVIIAAKAEDKAETIYEIADLAYHLEVLMAYAGITPEEVREELARRNVIDHKVKQEKMTGEKK